MRITGVFPDTHARKLPIIDLSTMSISNKKKSPRTISPTASIKTPKKFAGSVPPNFLGID